jgi:hypothetical protein
VLAACGGGSSPAQPASLPAATQTPLPTPVPLPLSVIPSCFLPLSNPASATCTKPKAQFGAQVNAAIDRVINERPDLFDLNDPSGMPRVLKYDAYLTAVVAAVSETPGLCGRVDAEGEIGVKEDNGYNEQWIVWSSGSYVRRYYVGACSPSTF